MSKQYSASIGSRLLTAGTGLMILVTAFPAWASLGGDVTSIQTDQLQLQGSRQVIAAESYTVHEIQGANGTVVREFVTAEGKVFAVAWHGPWMPDMRQILGSYFDQFTQAAQAKAQNNGRMGRRPLMINQPGLVVQNGGHLRAFVGRAYVPGLLPAGVGAEVIQ
jgi:Protein of unknown function (DUF2844)